MVGVFDDGSDHWHDARKAGIGGSEIATILGINNFQSPYVLWHIKKGVFEEEKQDRTGILEWGHRLEDAIAEKFAERNPKFDVYTGGSWVNKDCQIQLANPDRLIVDTETGEIGVLEIKTSMFGSGWEMNRVPEKYIAQVRWYLHTFGFSFGFISVLVTLGDYREFYIPADPGQPIVQTAGPYGKLGKFKSPINGPVMRAAAEGFWASIEANIPPPMDAGKDTYELLRRQNMSLKKGETVILPVEVGTYLLESKENLAKAEEEHQKARNHVMAHMGTAQYATYNDEKVAMRQAKGQDPPFLKLM